MKDLLFDADAFLCVCSLQNLVQLLDVDGSHWVMTEIIARRELSTIAAELAGFVATGRLRIEAIPARGTPASDSFKAFVREGHDRGESEAIAWATHLARSARPIFISNDRKARDLAKRQHVPSGDVMDLVVEAIETNVLSTSRATMSALDRRFRLPIEALAGAGLVEVA